MGTIGELKSPYMTNGLSADEKVSMDAKIAYKEALDAAQAAGKPPPPVPVVLLPNQPVVTPGTITTDMGLQQPSVLPALVMGQTTEDMGMRPPMTTTQKLQLYAPVYAAEYGPYVLGGLAVLGVLYYVYRD